MSKTKNTKNINSNPEEFQKPIGDFAEEAYKISADYINNHRHMPSLYDGCKDSYRRLIYSATLFKRGEMIPSTKLVSSVSALHPHSLSGIEDLYANLGRRYFEPDGHGGIIERQNVFTTIGEMGSKLLDEEGTELPHAALRYTQGRLSDLYWEILGDLIKHVPYQESPVSGEEPTYIPLPLPFCLMTRFPVSGLGIGVSNNICSFSPKSLYQAYIHNNPQLLEPNVDLILDKENSELEKLWVTGTGFVSYSYKISRHTLNGVNGILFEGSTDLFTPNFKKISKLADEGKVYFEPLSDSTGQKLFIGKIARDSALKLEDLEALCRKCCYSRQNYNLWVTNGKSTFRIGMRDWIDYTYKNYIELLTKVNKEKIEKCKFDILVLEALPYVSDYILNKNPKASDQEICKALELPQEVVEVVMSKPISYLRKNKDTAERVKTLKDKLKELKKFDPIKYTEEIINKL